MMGLSLLFTGVQFILEELFLGKYTINPLKVVGLEGMWGVGFYAVSLVILQNVRCDNFWAKSDVCSVNANGEWRVEDSIFALEQIFNNKFLFFLVVASTFTIAFYNFFGVSVTKYASSAQRAVVDNLRTILIWLFFMLVPTSIKEQFIWLQLFGFIGLVVGTLIYNEVIEIPCMDFDKYTKRNLELEPNEEERNIINYAKRDDISNYGVITPETDFSSKITIINKTIV